MPEKIKLKYEELSLMSLFQSISGAMARDCVIDDKMDRVIFIVNKGEMGLAIGKSGQSIKNVQNAIGKVVELVEYSDDPREFISNALDPKLVADIRLSEKVDGTKIATVLVDQKKKGAIVGRNGRNAEKARLLAKRYFEIGNIHIIQA
ncbi:MAG: NusA-like transcription termination signal-binding factor [Nitrososphaerales archaeon]|nr:NusA-like transcription termination signal-binding factor [Nitrososphaerota archaeon]